jgi:hypothetical protein
MWQVFSSFFSSNVMDQECNKTEQTILGSFTASFSKLSRVVQVVTGADYSLDVKHLRGSPHC